MCVWGLPSSIWTETTAVIHFSCEPFCHIKTQRISSGKLTSESQTLQPDCFIFMLVVRTAVMQWNVCFVSTASAHHAARCAWAISLIIFERRILKLSYYSLMQSSCWFASGPRYFIDCISWAWKETSESSRKRDGTRYIAGLICLFPSSFKTQ